MKVYTADFRPMKNVLAGRNERALFKIVVDGVSNKIVGAHMIGPDAPEILQIFAVAVKAGLRKAQLDECVAIHRTMVEELVLLKWSDRALHARAARSRRRQRLYPVGSDLVCAAR